MKTLLILTIIFFILFISLILLILINNSNWFQNYLAKRFEKRYKRKHNKFIILGNKNGKTKNRKIKKYLNKGKG